MSERPRVLVTRAVPGTLSQELDRLGMQPVHLPLVELFATERPPPATRPPSDGALVTSAAVLELAPHVVDWLRHTRVVAVGPVTARALVAAGVQPAVVAAGTGADALRQFAAGTCPWFIGAARPAPALAAAVASGQVAHWAVYDRRAPAGLHTCVRALEPVDLVTLASPSTARAWATLGDTAVPVVTIGPTTTVAAEGAGLDVAHVASAPSMQALADAARQALSDRWRG